MVRMLGILMMLALLPLRAGTASAATAGLRSQQSCSARRERLQPLVMQAFDFDPIAQKLLRRHWQQLNDAQRQRFRDAIADTAITRYASGFVASGGLLKALETRSQQARAACASAP